MHTKIKCKYLYDGIEAKLQPDMEILIDGQIISAVGHNLPCPENTPLIDLSSTSDILTSQR